MRKIKTKSRKKETFLSLFRYIDKEYKRRMIYMGLFSIIEIVLGILLKEELFIAIGIFMAISILDIYVQGLQEYLIEDYKRICKEQEKLIEEQNKTLKETLEELEKRS